MGALAFATVLALAPAIARADSVDADLVGRLQGCHLFSGGDEERKALEKAIDRVVDEFSFVLRPIVRSRLEDANPVIRRICVKQEEDRVRVTLDGREYTASLAGKTVKVVGITGDELRLRLELGKTALWQIFEGTDGGRVNGFVPGDAGRFVMKVRVFSERLPKDLIYKLSYRRQ